MSPYRPAHRRRPTSLPDPSDILLLALAAAALLSAGLVLGGLAAHPFAGQPALPAALTPPHLPEGVAGTPSPGRFERP